MNSKSSRNGELIGISFHGLQSRPQTYLEHRAPDPSCLGAGGIEKFRQEFIEAFSELAEAVPDIKMMSRLMKSGAEVRRRKMTERSLRRRRATVSV